MMIVNWHALRKDWIRQVRSELQPHLLGDRRFRDARILIGRFETAVTRWLKDDDFRPVINDANELCAAAEILRDLRPDDELFYEPRLKNTSKSIDFCVHWSDGGYSWLDMKTIAPQWKDDSAAWFKYSLIAADFPVQAQFITRRDFCGAAIANQALNARWSFVLRTVELEAKSKLLSPTEKGPVRLLFCSDGSWHKDDLEDFADFYLTGRFRQDDWAANAIARFMADRNLAFRRCLSGFCYLERRHHQVMAGRFAIDVRGPQLLGVVA